MSIRGRDRRSQTVTAETLQPVENQPEVNRFNIFRHVAAAQCEWPYGRVEVPHTDGVKSYELANSYDCFVDAPISPNAYRHAEMEVAALVKEIRRSIAEDLKEAARYPLD